MSLWSELCNAALNDNYDKIISMLENGTAAQVRDESGSNLLYYIRDNEELAKRLIAAGCNVEQKDQDGQTPLSDAVLNNYLKVAKVLLDAGASQDIKYRHKEFKPLHMAVCHGFVGMTKLLIKAGGDVNALDVESSTPLHIVVKTKEYIADIDLPMSKLLIEAGADLNIRDCESKTPLQWAIENKNYEFVKLLLDSGAKIDVQDKDSVTLLFWAVRMGRVDLAKRLIDVVADLNVTDSIYNQTALHCAVRNRRIKIVELLITAGANVNCTDIIGYSPLHWAVQYNEMDIINILLNSGKADVNIKDMDFIEDTEDDGPKKVFAKDKVKPGATILQVAAKCGFKDIVLLLLERGADVNDKCYDGRNALSIAAGFERSGSPEDDKLYLEILTLLLDHGAEIGDDHLEANSPFNCVLCLGNEQAVRLYLQRGVDITKYLSNYKDQMTLLGKIVVNKDISVLRFLLRIGNFDLKRPYHISKTQFALITLAMLFGFNENAKCLIEHGANVNDSNKFGNTPLFMATAYGLDDSVQVLLRCGADVNKVNKKKELILAEARKIGNVKIQRLLLRHIAMLKTQGRYVSQENDKIIRKDKVLLRVYNQCKAELTQMKTRISDGSITFFDILISKDIGAFARNKNIIKIFEAQDIKDYFPIYHDLLTERFSEELTRQGLMKKAVGAMSRILKFDAETFSSIFYKIFQYINNEDLQNLERVGHGTV